MTSKLVARTAALVDSPLLLTASSSTSSPALLPCPRGRFLGDNGNGSVSLLSLPPPLLLPPPTAASAMVWESPVPPVPSPPLLSSSPPIEIEVCDWRANGSCWLNRLLSESESDDESAMVCCNMVLKRWIPPRFQGKSSPQKKMMRP